MVSFDMSDRKKIGLGLTGFGVLFSFLGIIMLFDKGFLAMGNILFVSGVTLTIGLNSTVQFFTKPKNHKGSIAFGIGLFLVLIGWPVLGMMAESYGFIALFSGFWPTAAVYLQKTPPLVGFSSTLLLLRCSLGSEEDESLCSRRSAEHSPTMPLPDRL